MFSGHSDNITKDTDDNQENPDTIADDPIDGTDDVPYGCQFKCIVLFLAVCSTVSMLSAGFDDITDDTGDETESDDTITDKADKGTNDILDDC